MNQLITVPDYTPMTVNYIRDANIYINSTHREIESNPIIPWFGGYGSHGVMRLKLIKFYSKFIYRSTFRGFYYEREIIRDDPLECLRFIKNKYYKKLNFDRFTEEKVDYFLDTNVKEPSINSFCIIVNYLKIREPIVSYIEQKIGKTKELKQLKELFTVNNNLSFDEFLDKKSKFLMNVDLSGYVDELNKNTERKKRRVLK